MKLLGRTTQGFHLMCHAGPSCCKPHNWNHKLQKKINKKRERRAWKKEF